MFNFEVAAFNAVVETANQKLEDAKNNLNAMMETKTGRKEIILLAYMVVSYIIGYAAYNTVKEKNLMTRILWGLFVSLGCGGIGYTIEKELEKREII